MKKTLLILLTLSLILSLFSCTVPPETVPTSDKSNIETEDMPYTDSGTLGFLIGKLGNIMYRIYPEEAFMIPLCPDALCKHNDASCVFYDISENIYALGDTIYFVREKDIQNDYATLCSYDLTSGSFEVVYEAESKKALSPVFDVTEKYIFFNLVQFFKETKTKTHFLMRLDLKTGDIKQLSTKTELGMISLMCIEGERYYWHDYSTHKYFTTDENYQNRKDDQMGFAARNVTGGTAFESVIQGAFGGTGAIDVFKVDRNNGEKSLILEDIGMIPAFYNGKIIYSVAGKNTLIGYAYDSDEEDKKKEVYDKFGGEYMICDLDGSDQRVLCNITGTGYAIRPSCTISGDKSGIDDYLVLEVDSYKENKDGYVEKESGYKYISINIVTGEYKIVGAE